MPGEALKRKLKKDISFALRRGTIAQVTTALDAAQRAAEAELAVNDTKERQNPPNQKPHASDGTSCACSSELTAEAVQEHEASPSA